MQVCGLSHIDHRLPIGLPNRISDFCYGGQCEKILSVTHAQSSLNRIKPDFAAGASEAEMIISFAAATRMKSWRVSLE